MVTDCRATFWLAAPQDRLAFVALPFGNEFERAEADFPVNPLAGSILNIIWLIFFGLVIVASHLLLGLLFSLTIVYHPGLPFGIQHFKLAKVALWPFGLAFDMTEG